jgi:serine phosphatase RsbU (regulator of sigma subunit)
MNTNAGFMKLETEKTMSPELLATELEKLRKENEMLNLNVTELTKTNEFLVQATWRERDMKKKLHNLLEELKVTKKLVDEQNKSITDSINYASRIQDAIIPKSSDLKGKFRDAFIYYEAKSTVSGDFPWYFQNDKFTYIAAVDCTGHGVPGAMMSLIGHLLLNDLAKQDSIESSKLLTDLHWGIVKTLKQAEEGKQTADGMDVAMCRIDKANNLLQFSGAHRSLFHVSDGKLEVYQGDKFPIGGNQYKGKNNFTNHTIKFKENDTAYFFSDGLTDQFGGPDGTKFGAKRVRETLLASAHLEMQEQYDKIRHAYDTWKGDGKQIDDLLLIGIKF